MVNTKMKGKRKKTLSEQSSLLVYLLPEVHLLPTDPAPHELPKASRDSFVEDIESFVRRCE